MVKSKGLFLSKLTQSQGDTNAERVASIQELTHVTYKREVENLEMAIKDLEIKRDALIDFSSQGDVVKVAEFNAAYFVEQDIKMSLELEKLAMVLEVVKKRYESLFI
jgi:hypothetical protein